LEALLDDLAASGYAGDTNVGWKQTKKGLDALNARILFEGRLLLDAARQAGIGPDPKVSREGIDQQRAYRGTCVRAPALSTL